MADNKVKLIAFAGSTREGSFNKKLIRIAAEGAQEAGADVTLIDLKDYSLPLYDGDLEDSQGVPETALKLKEMFAQHHGFLIASPEYNSGYSAVLKNTIDWVSRPASPDEPFLYAFSGKTAAIMAASPGGLGGLRGLYQLRELLQNINVTVLAQLQAVGNAMEAFNEDGSLKDPAVQQQIKTLSRNAVRLAHIAG